MQVDKSRISISRRKLTKSVMETIQLEHSKDSIINNNQNDPLTPFDIRLLKEQILKESNLEWSSYSSSKLKENISESNDYSQIKENYKAKLIHKRKLNKSVRDSSVGKLKLSPRISDFYNDNKM